MKEVTKSPQYRSLIEKIESLLAAQTKPVLVAIDGRSGVGKSTIAVEIANEVKGTVIIGDDFFAGGPDAEWDERSTEAKVADCIDWRRLRKEALEPLLAGFPSSWHPFNFETGIGLSDKKLTCKPTAVIVLDGAYSCRPELADIVDISILIELPDEKLRRKRLLAREGQDFVDRWHRRWDFAEDLYFTKIVPRTRFDFVISIGEKITRE